MCFVCFVSVLFYLLLCIVFINALPKIFCPFIFFRSPFLFHAQFQSTVLIDGKTGAQSTVCSYVENLDMLILSFQTV